jgi:hypothetical protein
LLREAFRHLFGLFIFRVLPGSVLPRGAAERLRVQQNFANILVSRNDEKAYGWIKIDGAFFEQMRVRGERIAVRRGI